MVYATSRRFLEVFGLAKLGDLPALREVAELGVADEEDEAAPAEAPIAASEPPDDEPRIECAPDGTV
jgi:hypothetical protein